MRGRTWSATIALVAMVGGLVVAPVIAPMPAPTAQAAQATDFDPGNIVSDANFFAGDAMTAGEVQAFIDTKHSGCSAGYRCIDTYSQSTPTMPADTYCSALPGRSNESAASIIARVGAACDISQRFLIVLLEKEQSLITHRSPNATRYEKATGFGCPDTAPCDASVGGFFYQIYYGARQFQRYADHPGNYNYRAGVVNNVLYNPNAACGSSPVLIRNTATAGLYNYTPYQPNAAALANLYGTGDTCSAYGNRNTWRLWTDWFGNPTGSSGPPFGNFEAATGVEGGVQLSAWAIDPDDPRPVDIHVYIDGVGHSNLRADAPRPDVAAAYPAFGPAHGLTATLQVPAGERTVCLYAINLYGPGANVSLGCREVEVPEPAGLSGPPFGRFDALSATNGGARVSAWAIDPDDARPTDIHVYVDGKGYGAFRADSARPDIAAAYPEYGANHGFERTLNLSAGLREVCLYAIDLYAPGSTVELGCKSVTVEVVTGMSGPPFGNLEAVTPSSTGATVSGWVIDPDIASPTDVHIYVDGRGTPPVRAAGSRPDVAAAFPVFGAAHGFSTSLQLTPGAHQVCVFGIDLAGPGENVLMGCRDISVPQPAPVTSSVPFGNFEAAAIRGGVTNVSGWAIDPDTTGAIDVHVYVTSAAGTVGTRTLANLQRPDVGRAHPASGPAHGYAVDVPIAAGRSEICVAAINHGGGANVWLGCRIVTR